MASYKHEDRLLPGELHDLLRKALDPQKLLWEQISLTESESYCPHLEFWEDMSVCEQCGFHKCPDCEKLFTQFDIPGPQVCRVCSGDGIEARGRIYEIEERGNKVFVKCLNNDYIQLYFDVGLEYVSYGAFNAWSLVVEDRFGSVVIVDKDRFS